MKFVKRFLPLLAIVALILASCATQAGQVPKGAETPPPIAEGGPQQPQVQPEAEVEKPSVEKSELQSLFEQASNLKDEAIKFGLDSILSDKFQEANKKHDTVSAKYKDLVEAPAQYDGAKAYPLKDELAEVVSTWDELIQEGNLICPEMVKMERNGADLMRSIAIDADAPMMASAQYDIGLQYCAQAEIYAEDSRFLEAINSYKLATAAFENSAIAAEVNKLRENIENNGYSSYESIQMYLAMGEEKYQEAQDLWQRGSIEDIAASTSVLKEAKEYYYEVNSKGSNLKALEAKDKAIVAQDEAIKVNADLNAPYEYQNALDIFAEAEKNMEEADYISAYSSYIDATTVFEAARDISQAMAFDAASAIAEAEAKLADAKDRASELGLEDNIYLIEANQHLDNAKALERELKYSAAIFETNEVSNYIGLSDSFVQQEAEIREKARLEQLEKDKAASEKAIADAKARIAWADQVELKSDYPKQYASASNAMAAAEKAYQIEKYAAAKTLAEEVSATLSDDFQRQVLAARELAKIKAAEEEASRLKAIAKQAADAAIADAESRMAWANENQIRADYEQEYKNASVAMVSAYVAYGNEDYLLSKQKAEEVSGIFSNDFQAQVAADRAAKEQLAKDKAAADEVMPKARDRMVWADQNNIKTDYSAVYNSAHSAMEAAEKAYQIEKYAAATQLANEVLSTLSSEFEAKVASEREAKEMAIEIQKASKAAEALGIAHSRMAWAVQVDLASDYPDEYRDADTSMQAADKAYSEKAYDASVALANDVVRIISDDFQRQVLAARELAKIKAAEEEASRLKAIAKQAADAAIADAESRMAWANENQIRADYEQEYKNASVAMVSAYVAYGNEDYLLSKQKAEEVSGIFSNDFQAQVAADRAAKEQLAKDKAAADEVMPKARDRMVWADQNNIKTDYSAVYNSAHSAMEAAEKAYQIEKYAAATQLANEVLSTLSSEFEAKVASEREAKEMAIEIQKASKAAEALGIAHSRMAWAVQVDLASDYPDEYRDADTSMQAADKAYSEKAYDASVALANDVVRIISDDLMAEVNALRAAAEQLAADKAMADEIMPKARDRMVWADLNNIKADYPAVYNSAHFAMEAAEKAYQIEKYAAATKLADEVLSTLSPDFEAKVAADHAEKTRLAAEAKAKEEAEKEAQALIAQNKKYAETAISDAKSRYDWAASKNAANNYPDLFKKGGDLLADAQTAFNALDYEHAKDLAAQSYWTLMEIGEFAPLPATYKVRLIPERRDCLWRIAEYPFVYNNPYKWPVLYEANKKTFKDPSNPNLIFPDQVLTIPSIKGEVRKGAWDPKKTYQPLTK